MPYMQTAISVLIAGLTLSTAQAASHEHSSEGFRQHDAHVHGHVELNIAQDGNQLLMEITAPGADIVGFEHAPKNEAQHQAMTQAQIQLKAAEQLFTLNTEAKCQLTKVNIEHSLKNANHKEDEHEHEHEHEHHDDSSHGEFTAYYDFQCQSPDKLSMLKTQWFTAFPSTEHISVNSLTDRGQKSAQLNNSHSVFHF